MWRDLGSILPTFYEQFLHHRSQKRKNYNPEAVFLVMLGATSFPARNELFSCFPIYLASMTKNTASFVRFFALSGSALVKAALKTLMKLTLSLKFSQIVCLTSFIDGHFAAKFSRTNCRIELYATIGIGYYVVTYFLVSKGLINTYN